MNNRNYGGLQKFNGISSGRANFSGGSSFDRKSLTVALNNLRRQDSTRYPIVLDELPEFERADKALPLHSN